MTLYQVFIRFLIGSVIYPGIEVWYDNTSHRSMGLVGGLAFVTCCYIAISGIPYWLMAICMASVITLLEYAAGHLWNDDYSIWDYRKMPFNLDGQVCLTFYMIWLIVMPPVIIWLHYLLP